MIRLLWRFALLAALAAGFAWLADHPGTVTVIWRGKEITTSVVAGAALLLAAIIVLMFLASLLRRLWRGPAALGGYWRFRRNRKGYESLSRGIVAAGAGDAVAAARHAAIAGNALGDEPLVHVLAAQAAQLRGDRVAVKRIFQSMAAAPDTEALGLRGLFAEAKQAGDFAAAMAHAERALKLNPRLTWASTAVLQLRTLAKDWVGAAEVLAQQSKSGHLPVEEARRKQAAMLAAAALASEDGDKARALDLAVRSRKLDGGLVPAALVAARIYAAQGPLRKAVRVIREAWSKAAHPDLAELFAHLKLGDGPDARFERVRDLVGDQSGGSEAGIALARAAVEAQRWDVARKALEPLVAERPQARVCALMADIEEAQGDKGRAREWLARALRAPRDPMWVSDGVASLRWTPVSPVSGEIVPCEWKVPFETPGEVGPLPATGTAAAVVAAPRNVAISRQLAPTVQAESFRPPDDPGPAGDFVGPESAARRTLAVDS